MKKKLIKATLSVVCISAAVFGSWKTYSTYNVNTNNAELLLLEDVEALSDFDISGWLNNITRPIEYYNQKTWIKKTVECTITETETSGSIDAELTVGYKGIASATIGGNTGSTTITKTYKGHKTTCVYDEEKGELEHCDSDEDCIKD